MFEVFDKQFVEKHLLTAAKYQPFPTYEEGDYWTQLPVPVKEEMVRRGEHWLTYPWPSLLAARYMDFQRNGNRSRYEAVYFERRTAVIDLMIAECIDRQGRFVDSLINGAWLIMEETSWTIPAHDTHDGFMTDPLPDPEDSPRDLFACETAAQMAVLYQVMGERLSAESLRLTRRIRDEVLRRVVRPVCRSYTHWMGLNHHNPINNWAPWCSSTTLIATLILGETEAIRRQYTHQVLATLERFVSQYGDDGGCDEGPAYWSRAAATLYECLEILFKATDGALTCYQQPKIAAMGLYLPRMHIAKNWYVDFADCGARLSPAPDLIFRYGRATGSAQMMDFAANLAQRNEDKIFSHTYSVLSAMAQLDVYQDLVTFKPKNAPTDPVWLKSIEVMVAQSGDFTVAAKGGHNGESHNHNDIGQFILYYRGEPLVIDAGTLAYTKNTFSEKRYSIWTMQSSYHNLPDFGGYQQAPGPQYRAKDVIFEAGETLRLSLDAAEAWPAEVGVRKMKRSLSLDKNELTIKDDYELDQALTTTFHFLLANKPIPQGENWRLTCAGGDVLLSLEGTDFCAATVDLIEPKDEQMNNTWGQDAFFRLNIILPTACCGTAAFHFTPCGEISHD